MSTEFNLGQNLAVQQQALALAQKEGKLPSAAQLSLVVIASLLGGSALSWGLSFLLKSQEQWGLILALTSLAGVASVLFVVQLRSALTAPDLVAKFTEAKQNGKFQDCESGSAVLAVFQKEAIQFKGSEVVAVPLCALATIVSPLWYLVSNNAMLYLGLPFVFLSATLILGAALLFKERVIESVVGSMSGNIKAYFPSRELFLVVIKLGCYAAFLSMASFAVLEVCKQRELTDLVGRLNTAVYLLSSTHKGNVETGSWMTKEAPLANDVFLRKWEDKIKAAHPEFGSDVKIDTFFKVSIADLPFQGTNYAVYAVVLRVPKHIAEQHPAPFKDSGPVIFERIPSELEAKLARVAEENVLRSFRTP